ncbi:hypothetical protein N7481_012862 [Penicillium waksmanii]|uniref:uncharacterized protein n=1 Tax=Penicillium waksmanii TaxID=69791 RepID=UPI002548043D|nr:uncharacterized protein N7481_012862 [Penicillium waksmanii]KAJ5966148.1 hypothetical protein N7481_012862 [Penicillium waksmanii]
MELKYSRYDEFIDYLTSLLYQVKEHLTHDYHFIFTDVPPSWGAAAWDRIEELDIVQTRGDMDLLLAQATSK